LDFFQYSNIEGFEWKIEKVKAADGNRPHSNLMQWASHQVAESAWSCKKVAHPMWVRCLIA
jgi:hypothetical protein